MRILIDATSALLRSAGIKSYTWHWIRNMRRIAGKDAIRAFPFLDELGELDHENSPLPRWATLPRIALLYLVNLPGQPVLDWIAAGADVFHASNMTRRPPRRVKVTATIHDLTCWLMPELHTAANVRADRQFAERVLQRADGLIAVSENTRQDAIRILGIPPEKIRTIYSGVDERFFEATPARRKRPYVLYVGTIEPRKNLDTLLDAWLALPPSLRDEYELVIAGPAGWAAENTLARIRNEASYLGYVSESDLPGLTAGATVFAYPSLYEGFGFPVAQAMAAGVPVVTSSVSSLPEVAGTGAVLVDPRSQSEIAAALQRLLTSPSLRAEIALRGREQARNYRWESCAQESLRFFRDIANRAARR